MRINTPIVSLNATTYGDDTRGVFFAGVTSLSFLDAPQFPLHFLPLVEKYTGEYLTSACQSLHVFAAPFFDNNGS